MIDNNLEYSEDGKLIINKTQSNTVTIEVSDNVKYALGLLQHSNPEFIKIAKEKISECGGFILYTLLREGKQAQQC